MRRWYLGSLLLFCGSVAFSRHAVRRERQSAALVAAVRNRDSAKALELLAAQPRVDVVQRSADGTTRFAGLSTTTIPRSSIGCSPQVRISKSSQ